MRKRNSISKPEYSFAGLELKEYRARVEAAINHEIRDKRLRTDDSLIYEFSSSIEVTAVVTYPDERVGDEYILNIYGHENGPGEHKSTLADYHVRDDEGLTKYRKVRGQLTPVYEPPKGIGVLERQRGAKTWSGAAWVAPRTVSDMLALLPHVRPLYLSIHERKEGRYRSIVSFSLQTTDPAEE